MPRTFAPCPQVVASYVSDAHIPGAVAKRLVAVNLHMAGVGIPYGPLHVRIHGAGNHPCKIAFAQFAQDFRDVVHLAREHDVPVRAD